MKTILLTLLLLTSVVYGQRTGDWDTDFPNDSDPAAGGIFLFQEVTGTTDHILWSEMLAEIQSSLTFVPDDQIASEVPFTPYSTLAATDTQAAIQELLDESTGTDDQDATEVPFTPSGTLAATDVDAALQELDGDVQAISLSDPPYDDLAGGTVLTLGAHHSDTLAVNRTYTFTGSPVDGQETRLALNITATSTVSFPSATRVGTDDGAITSLLFTITGSPEDHFITFIYDGADYWVIDSQSSAAVSSSAVAPPPLTVANPDAADDITWFYTPVAITVTELVTVIRGGTDVTPDVRHGLDRSAAGSALITTPAAATSTTTGDVISSFDDATIPANSFVWLEYDGVTGSPVEAFHSIEYTRD